MVGALRRLFVHNRATMGAAIRLRRHWCRLLSTATASPGAATPPPPSTPEYTPGFVSRHAGKLFLALLGTLGGYFYTASKSNKMSKTIKKGLEDGRALEPWEIDELRLANDGVITRERMHELALRVKEAFPEGQATYKDFIKVCRGYLNEQGVSFKLGHYLDRVILFYTPQSDQPIDLMVLLMALTLTLNTSIADRVAAIHDIGVVLCGKLDSQTLSEITRALIATDQIPPEVRVVRDPTQKYPIQLHKVATPMEMAQGALHQARDYQSKKAEEAAKAKEPPAYPGPVLRLNESEGLTVDDLVAVFASQSVCAWGECFSRRKTRR